MDNVEAAGEYGPKASEVSRRSSQTEPNIRCPKDRNAPARSANFWAERAVTVCRYRNSKTWSREASDEIGDKTFDTPRRQVEEHVEDADRHGRDVG